MFNEENIVSPEASYIEDFNKKLKSWYLQNHRRLPWRETKDPYKIWLSEIILQQTRVAQGLPYYEKFVANYPTIAHLAEADERDVLRLWQGLGYYSRARNMHYTARRILADYGGEFPRTSALLARLKGLGTYTAAAIASFAFDEQVPAIDGNVYRVMSRIFGIKTDILSNEGKKEFYKLAVQLIPADDPATYNQAMIEFGAIQCVPVNPLCHFCVFLESCYAFQHGVQGQLPVKAKKLKVKQRFFQYLVVESEGKLVMRERSGKDIWKGLYDFPMVETETTEASPDIFVGQWKETDVLQRGRLREVPGIYTHILTHQRLNVRFWWLEISPESRIELPGDFTFYSKDEIELLPKPILIQSFLQDEKYL